MERTANAKIVKAFMVTPLETRRAFVCAANCLVVGAAAAGCVKVSVTSKAPLCSRVAPLTNCEIITAERALAVMTGHAALSATGCVMIQRFRRGDLPSLWHPGSNLMTFVAGNLLMLCMTKANAKGLRELRRPSVSAQLMASAARRNIAAVSLSPGSVASIAGRMRVESHRDRHSYAATRRSMTCCAANASHLEMKRVIEGHSEALQTRE
jgi:hypothetical protein